MDIKIETLEEQWESTYEKWQMQLIPSVEMELLNNMFSDQLAALLKERKIIYDRMIEMKQTLNQAVNSSSDGQESANNIKSEIDDKKSDDQTHQIIGSFFETKNSVDNLLQDQQPELLQVQQIKSSDNTIKMIDIYEMEEKIKQSVINEIEGQIIKPDADYKNDKGTLDQEQMYANSVDKSDTFRGGTDFKLFNPSTIMFQQDDSKTMAAIMFGAQTAKQFQKNDQHQDDMKDNPISRGKRKTQKSVKFQIEEDKVIEAYVTHWQELEKQDRVQQGQELEQQDHSLSKYAIFIREDHNFRHGAVQQISPNTMPTISRHTVSWLAGV